MEIADDITKLIGGTPLVRLRALSESSGATIVGKLESFNPGGSVKDRIGLAMIEAAEQAGLIAPGRTTLVEPTSGNTGIALAMVAAARGYRLILTMPETFSIERRNLLRAYGAAGRPDARSRGHARRHRQGRGAARRRPRQLHAPAVREPGQPRRPPAHDRRGDLARHRRRRRRPSWPAWARAARSPAWARCSRSASPAIKVYAVEPAESAVLSGGQPGPHRIQGIGAGFVPEVLDTAVYDEVVQVPGDKAMTTARALAADEGILVGISAGANAFAAAEVGARPEHRGKLIVTILCDTGERYLSTPLFADQGAPAMIGG